MQALKQFEKAVPLLFDNEYFSEDLEWEEYDDKDFWEMVRYLVKAREQQLIEEEAFEDIIKTALSHRIKNEVQQLVDRSINISSFYRLMRSYLHV